MKISDTAAMRSELEISAGYQDGDRGSKYFTKRRGGAPYQDLGANEWRGEYYRNYLLMT